ncbi:hypothetical protein [Serinibacter arcticus]|uniref:hypothetical protein n=1 Tax=Serinibacter arcticus TaxID=1655435 RepID=UPI0018EE65D7|nr:hypothetical protein [Serinibacter arcticus]
MQLTLRVTGPLPPVEVWERYALPARWPQWGPYLRDVELTAPRIVPGARGGCGDRSG